MQSLTQKDAESANAQALTTLPGARILLLDADAESAAQLAAIVSTLGLVPCPAAIAADEALQQARSCSPDAVLMDIRLLHAANGMQLAERLRRELDLRVIYVLTERDDTLVERALQTLPYAYVHRPVRPFDLRCSLSLALYQRRLERAEAQRDKTSRAALVQTLSTRELAVMRLIALGHTSKDIAGALSIAKPTVDTYRRRITEKLGIRERTDIVRIAVQAGLLEDR
jgi:two-component system invasion response regulator UvrY